jgi:hypothetical protein
MLMKLFKKRTEDFTCEHCGTKVQGNGYTNHCPNCLWSKHVDQNPGDRLNECKGLMEPVGIEQKDGQNVILQRCIKCKFEKRNKVEPNDNYDIIVQLSALV